MIDEVVKMLEAQPFEPFAIQTIGSSRYRVTSRDHAFISPRRTKVVIMFDDDTVVPVSAKHIAAVIPEPVTGS